MIEVLKMTIITVAALAIIALPQIVRWVTQHYNKDKWEQ